jgi:hypothetical protein
VDKDEPLVVTWPSDDDSCTDDEENWVEERMQATTWSIQGGSVVEHGEELADRNYRQRNRPDSGPREKTMGMTEQSCKSCS